MKNNNQHNDELQIALEGFAQILQEIKEAVMNNPHSGLTADLLIKIQQTIDQSKKGITAEELEIFRNDLIDAIKKMQEEANQSFIGFLNEKVEEMSQLSKRSTIVENRYSIDFKSSKMWIAMIIAVFLLVVSGIGNYNQYQDSLQYKDNDLKYRYIKMVKGIDASTLFRLERIFDSPDSIRIVKNIQVNVTDYEQRLKEKIQKEEQKERLEKEIDDLNIN